MILKGKTAIVTGGGRDIGRAISRRLAALGARVAINYFNNAEGAEATLEDIRRDGGEAIVVRADEAFTP